MLTAAEIPSHVHSMVPPPIPGGTIQMWMGEYDGLGGVCFPDIPAGWDIWNIGDLPVGLSNIIYIIKN